MPLLVFVRVLGEARPWPCRGLLVCVSEEKPGLGRAAVGFVRVLEGKPGLCRAAVCLFVCIIEGKPGLGRAAACMFV